MTRAPGMSVRLKLTLSYAAVVMLVGAGLLATVWVFLLRYVPDFSDPTLPFSPTRSDLQEAFVPRVAQALVVLLVVGLVGGWLLAGRMLAPLRRITSATTRAAAGSLSHRIELEGRDDELRQLADSVDTMLDRLEAHVAEQQRFAANASHELRTPLAITQTLLEVARQDPGRDADALLDRLQSVNTRAIDLTESLLVLSRADSQSFSREPVDLSLVAEDVAETLLPLAEKHGIALKVEGGQAWTLGSPSLLSQLTSNLVTNAIVHNVEGGRVLLTTTTDASGVRLVVENDGQVLTPSLVATFTEPFRRGTERVHSGHAGVGLGLAIVNSIVRSHDGTLALHARPDGGLRVTVLLHAAPHSTA